MSINYLRMDIGIVGLQLWFTSDNSMTVISIG